MITNERIKSFDGLRGAAALHVMLFHTYQMKDHLWSPIKHFLYTGHLSVLVFFVLSGFLIYQSLSKLEKLSPRWHLNFYITRFFRIIPLWWLVLTFYFFIPGMPFIIFLLNAIFGFGFLSYDPKNMPIELSWSLFVEEIFYLFVPFLFIHLKKLQHFLIAFLLCFAASVLWMSYAESLGVPSQNYFISRHPIANFYYLVGGLFVGWSYKKDAFRNLLADISKSRIRYALDFLVLVCIIGATSSINSLAELGFFLIVFTALIPNTLSARFFSNPILQWAGKRCYAIYIIHIPLYYIWFLWFQHELRKTFNILLLPSSNFSYLLFIILLIAMVEFLWRFWEAPWQKFGKKLIAR